MRKTTLALAAVSVFTTANLAAAMGGPSGEPAREASASITVNLPPQTLRESLNGLAKQTGLQILWSAEELPATLKAPRIEGKLTPQAALEALLKDTGLHYDFLDKATVAITNKKIALNTGNLPYTGTGEGQGVRENLRLAQVEDRSKTDPASVEGANKNASENSNEGSQNNLEEIVVTGTHIRGVGDQFSPVTTITRDAMDTAGFRNVSDYIASLPQNFGGGVSPDVTTAGSSSGAGGATVNLRGLGNEATLILLNGHRLAPSGLFGNFVDISSIPTSAIERIEVVTDGASAIYGADAIGGVVNILLRKDFQGAETRAGVEGGAGDVLQLGQTFGTSTARTHALVTYEYASQDELDANDRSFSKTAPDPTYLLPSTRRNSVVGSFGTQLTDSTSVSVDAYYNKRDTRAFFSSDVLAVFENFQDVNTEQFGGTANLDMGLAGDWGAMVSAGYSRGNYKGDTIQLNLGNDAGYIDRTQSDLLSAEASVNGPLVELPAGPMRGAFGVQYRSESSSQLSIDRLTLSPLHDIDRDRHVAAAYTEFLVPLVSERNPRPGIHRLSLTVAARFDDYSDVGSSFDPKVGLSWAPMESLTIRGTYGTSFRAPRLDQLIDDISAAVLGVYADPASPTGKSVALQVLGSTSDLSPEKARSWTAGFDFTPGSLPQLKVRGTYFSVHYTDRVAQPFASLNGQFEFDNFPAEPDRNPSLQEVSGLVDNARAFFNFGDFFPSLGNLTLNDVTVILDQRAQNVSSSKVNGIDLDLSWRHRQRGGDLAFMLNSTYLTNFEQRFSSVTPVQDLRNTFGNPVDLRVRAGVQWQTQLLTTSVFLNYADSYTDDKATGAPEKIDSWTTADIAARFDLGRAFGGGFAQGAFLSLTMLNVFDQNPPRIGPAVGRAIFYDSANADPGGRRVGLQLTKRW